MKKIVYLVIIIGIILSGCQAVPATSKPSPASPAQADVSPTPTLLPGLPTATPTPSPSAASPTPSGPPLPAIAIDWTQSFPAELPGGEQVSLTAWEPQPYAGEDIPLPLSLDQVANPQVLDGLTAEQKSFLEHNGFVAIHSQEPQFGDIRVETARLSGQPYYLTTDAAFHALHLLFDDMLKAVEREYFKPQIMAITQAVADQLVKDLAILPNADLAALPGASHDAETGASLDAEAGASLEAETRAALAYLSVALRLFDPSAAVDPSVEAVVAQQVDQIINAAGRDKSALFPDFEDDYAAYLPTGHYTGDPDLEAYYRGMTWFGRMHFLLKNQENPAFVPSRLPLIVTLALRLAQVDGQPASQAWADLHETLTYLVGPSDDAGPLEYAALMDMVYGDRLAPTGLADENLWQDFITHADQLPAPQINSLFVASTRDLNPEKGWRFLGQRFTLDGQIMQNVIFDRLEAKPDGTKRALPSGLDVMAAFGSQPALAELDKQGVTDFPNYPEQMAMLQQAVQDQPEAEWLTRFYDGWLYAFLPVVKPKDGALPGDKRSPYPTAMQTPGWGYKDLNAALGSWAELKHDTVLYTKMPEMAGGGGPPMSGPAPSLVEPNPPVFYRLAYIARRLSCGLQNRLLYQPCEPGPSFGSEDAAAYIVNMGSLGERFETLGIIAAKELAGEPLTADDLEAITSCLGMTECLNTASAYSQPQSKMPKVPVIAAVSGAIDSVLEVGVGDVDRIYVVVPLEEKWEIAQGGVFSYYEFAQPRAERLTDDEWREILHSDPPALPTWTANFLKPDGVPTIWLSYRIGDFYVVTEAGDNLNMREGPSRRSPVIMKLRTGNYLEIIGGPVQAEGFTWWQVKALDFGDQPTGWIVETQDWLARSYLP